MVEWLVRIEGIGFFFWVLFIREGKKGKEEDRRERERMEEGEEG